MTIITKPISEKKIDKLEVPLVKNEQLEDVSGRPDIEAPAPVDAARFVVLRARARRVSTTTTLCLLITALMVVSIGIVGGTYLYRQYVRTQMHRLWCRIPYGNQRDNIPFGNDQLRNIQGPDSDSQAMLADSDLFHFVKQDEGNNVNYLFEEFDLDLENENYEKIYVPDFRDGRKGRFIHDFNSNVTGIIDLDDHRCFVMPLDRQAVLPPRSLFDLIHKIWEGYYKVDTETVRETMKVITPPLTDTKSVGTYIARECRSYPVYKLEKYISGVFKRSADLEEGAKFVEFSGSKIVEFDIVNLADVLEFEKNEANMQR